ncbi:MAG TPA: cupin domain-containing protein [Gemmatimonadaceae bacterium]|nr:cupin domain-containing protein [Gemmatimonadaceae bacterium]
MTEHGAVAPGSVTRRDFAALTGIAALGAFAPSGVPVVGGREQRPTASLAERMAMSPAEPIPPFTYNIEATEGKVTSGGYAKEATVKEFAISEGLAGVSMRLKPGGLRELHWHALAAEWAYMVKGHCRVTVFDPDGHNEVVDFSPGDIWYFPRGYGHSLQGLGPDETHFVLIFDNGHFSEYGTFSITDWMALTPASVLAKNFGTSAATFANLPKKEVYIGTGRVPAPLPLDPPPGSDREGSLTHRYRLLAQVPKEFPGGTLRVASSVEFPISTTMTGAFMTLKPGALRAMHWHPNADEWQYWLSGRGRVTLFGSSGRARTEDIGPGQVVYIPRGFGHHIESTGPDEAHIIIGFNSGIYQESSFAQWLHAVPPELVTDNLGISESVVTAWPNANNAIVSAEKY